ncbi:hypothetical protein [Anaerotruncus colihominis]|uniref:Uncharacterized protein n=3 Tax=Anaerotruncus colihominis TaxID=169435 RepID=B0PEX1_9FIRM|nr:hypothetical protein [Anaerotruncus colihominis]EDS09904.1 hypothetical protein ANACOL_03349 [Anaerotruncus colihominis DSM 17241]OUP66948.1 hypothetical protein B5F11_18805 [Anaerotruncus colihominis]OUP70486.1 hypothetical protein B5F10_18915 [Anaerotruncus colihominis]UWN73955.1 hypothetical protein NQ528_12130 [Anaerotruncus colihominis]
MKKELLLSMSDDTFAAMKMDFDSVLNDTITNMEDKKADLAEITLKLKITLAEAETTDEEVVNYEAMREIIKPKFEHKISSVMQVKDSRSGKLEGDYELVYDREAGCYKLRELTHGQTSLFDQNEDKGITTKVDGSYVVVDVDFHNADDNTPKLDGQTRPALPAPKSAIDLEGDGEEGEQ